VKKHTMPLKRVCLQHTVTKGIFMKYILSLFISLFFIACSTLEVHYDYDENYQFSTVKTFSIVHNVKEGENTLLNDRITDALKNVLLSKGYTQVSRDNADLIFVYHYGAKDKVDIQTDYQMVGIRRRGFGGTMIATTTAYEYTEGTIIIDALDTKTNKIVWRSVGTLEVEEKKTPQERKEYVQKIISEVMKDFPSHSIKH